jgi:flavin-dependent dehydrogenase
MSDPGFDFDFAVAGAGPAGSSAAIALAQLGHSVVVFERENFPRFHIGESLLATANDAFAKLGVTERMAEASFVEKWGARLVTHDGQSGRTVDFVSAAGIQRPQTYQVCREKFDHILMERAREAGADVREAHRVTACEFANDAAVLDYTRPDGTAAKVRVRAMVDATGRNGILARKFGLRKDEPLLANIAVFSHFSNVPLLPDDRPGDIRIVSRDDAGWWWLIPIEKNLMSVGVVIPKSLYATYGQETPEVTLERAIRETPIVAQLMQNAKREWPVRVEKDFSYSASGYAGDRWILAGDAGSFLDPVFSTGVSIAMESGIEAAEELDRAKKAGDFSAKRFAAFSKRQKKRFTTFRKFVIGFYSPEFRDLFYDPNPPRLLFDAIITILAGRWDAGRRTSLLNRLFFVIVALQRRFPLTRKRFRRGVAAGYAK